jgi:hydrogenase expression/formation protein HypE
MSILVWQNSLYKCIIKHRNGGNIMEAGKLPNEVLKDIIISKIVPKNSEVLVGPDIGEDCAVIDFGEDVCVLTTDPVTATTNNAGTIGVHICCNDIASAGVRPIGAMVTILAPVSCKLEDIKSIMDEVNRACEELSIDVLGGHTEITDAVNRMVLSITAIGKGKKGEFIRTGGAKEGDDIVLTGFAGLEGTSILSKDYYEYLKDKLDEDTLKNAQNMLQDISVVKAGLIASKFGVTSMHDATEGGVLGAIWEVAEASKKGAYVYENKIPIKKETLEICNVLNIDPYRLISSGCMVITCKDGEGLCKVLMENGIEATVVGKIIERRKILNKDGVELEISPPEADEIYKVKI